jgi:hypothetical protein
VNFYVFSGEPSPKLGTDKLGFKLFDQSCVSLADGELSRSNLEILSNYGEYPNLFSIFEFLSSE